jgi:hypothetical protein
VKLDYKGLTLRQKLEKWWKDDHGRFNTYTVIPAIISAILVGAAIPSVIA